LNRRALLLLGSSVAWPAVARAQPSMLRVGAVAGQPRSALLWTTFEQRMAALGYREGKNLSVNYVQADSLEGYQAGYQRLSRSVDVVVAPGAEASLKSAMAFTQTVPIVMIAIDCDPLAAGYVKGLARPGGNVTGVFLQQIELAAKRVEFLKDAFPDQQAMAVFWDRIASDQWTATQQAGAKLGLRLAGVELGQPPYDYAAAYAQVPPEARAMLLVMTSPFFFRDRAQLADLAIRHRAVSMFGDREWVEAGGLLSYGVSITGMFARAAEYVDRIARGAKPGELPIEQPTKFELAVNLKTAKAIGVTLPPLLLARADQTIE
jgi:putative ABC transport system substrate-binding protein